ncbi:MAG: ribose-phosphate pyrophosphokinase [Clostridiales bacterium]|nr:ribose-phosphate pyrophosphokinase [Clostridiales bacterium]
MSNRKLVETIPIAPLKIIALEGCKELGETVNHCVVEARRALLEILDHVPAYLGYDNDTYLVDYSIPRFGTGEAKAVINETIRGCDLFIIADVMNYTNMYKINGEDTMKSPDDHFQDLKRVIAAAKISKVYRINVIIPFLYESRQHRRDKLESLDCAYGLQELSNMGVENIITFDAHDARVQNAIPIRGFDNFFTSLQFIRELLFTEENVLQSKNDLMIISPDEGGMTRAVYYANVLGVEMGMFYKRRDYTQIVDGRNPIVAHEFLGSSVEGKDVFIIDDIISSGESILDVARELKKRKARRVFVGATFGLFCNGIEKIDEAYKNGDIDRIYTTNLVYTPQELFTRPYYKNVDMSKYISLIVDTLNHDTSVNDIINPSELIQELLQSRRQM